MKKNKNGRILWYKTSFSFLHDIKKQNNININININILKYNRNHLLFPRLYIDRLFILVIDHITINTYVRFHITTLYLVSLHLKDKTIKSILFNSDHHQHICQTRLFFFIVNIYHRIIDIVQLSKKKILFH